jgi:hypothetical protein
VRYQTSKTTTGTGDYSMQIIINPEDKNVEYCYGSIYNRNFALQRETEQRRQTAEELRDMFLCLPVRNREIASDYVVDAEGNQRTRGTD